MFTKVVHFKIQTSKCWLECTRSIWMYLRIISFNAYRIFSYESKRRGIEALVPG